MNYLLPRKNTTSILIFQIQSAIKTPGKTVWFWTASGSCSSPLITNWLFQASGSPVCELIMQWDAVRFTAMTAASVPSLSFSLPKKDQEKDVRLHHVNLASICVSTTLCPALLFLIFSKSLSFLCSVFVFTPCSQHAAAAALRLVLAGSGGGEKEADKGSHRLWRWNWNISFCLHGGGDGERDKRSDTESRRKPAKKGILPNWMTVFQKYLGSVWGNRVNLNPNFY